MTAVLMHPYVAFVGVCWKIVVGTPQTAAHFERPFVQAFLMNRCTEWFKGNG